MIDFYGDNIAPPNKAEQESIGRLYNKYKIDADMFCEAVRTAVLMGKPKISYIGGIIRNKVQSGVKTGEEFRESEKERIN